MILSLFRRNRPADTISTLYGMIVAQARLPIFYRDYAVADTVNGRFDLLLLHLAPVVVRLGAEPAFQPQSQALFDRFCRDMDDNLREIGISDLKVPKEMRRMGEAFYGRAEAYRQALAADGTDALAATISRNVYGGVPLQPALPGRLAVYMREGVRRLNAQPAAAIAAGQFTWPDPARLP